MRAPRRPPIGPVSRLVALVATLLAIAVLALLAGWFAPPALTLNGRASAADGDSLRIGATRIRIIGIDAPEFDQTCTGPGAEVWECGAAAHRELSRLVAAQPVTCHSEGLDRYGRTLARCDAAGRDLGDAMVRAGLAVADGDYGPAEAEARSAGRGIWSGPFDRPAEWRAHHGGDAGFDFFAWIRSWLG